MHEMDAIRCKEWRIFPGLSLLNDLWGYRFFMLAHIPLFLFLFLGLSQTENSRLIFGLDVFFIIHVGLHLLFLLHKKNEFKDWISWTIIVMAGVFGLLDIL
jgi:L-cystine uptake protein TcyP (sodium:dicarboxylate symporter family)